MAKITVFDHDEICVDNGSPFPVCISGKGLRKLMDEDVLSRRNGDIVRIDGQVHSVDATKRALKLFDAFRDAFKGWSL